MLDLIEQHSNATSDSITAINENNNNNNNAAIAVPAIASPLPSLSTANNKLKKSQSIRLVRNNSLFDSNNINSNNAKSG